MYTSLLRRVNASAPRFRTHDLRVGLTSLSVLMIIAAGSVCRAAGTYGPWGDVDGSGAVDLDDGFRTSTYVLSPGTLTAPEKERVKRYGDVAGVTNQNFIGNGAVDTHDVQRMLIIGGGVIDAGTAGAAPAGYGDVNSDGQVNIVDAVMTQRSVAGTASVNSSRADISPTTPYISFGDGAINGDDANVVLDRAAGTDANPPAYTDYWPMHLPGLPAGSLQDKYTYVDVNGKSGDFNHQTEYRTQAREEIGGYTITRIDGSDNTSVGVFKGQDGSIYALYLQYPVAFQGRRVTFSSPVKVLDAAAAAAGAGSWSMSGLSADTTDYGVRPARIRGTVLGKSDVYTPAAGQYPAGSPPSEWSDTTHVRLDVALLAIPTSNFDMQQALFFDFAPFIGLVSRGQARLQGAAAPESDKPLTSLTDATVRGIRYTLTSPTP
jgi:hypothetical protein